MDHYGIGNAIKGVVHSYLSGARRSGRTTSLIESLKTGDRVCFTSNREAERVRQLCGERGVQIQCIVCDPKDPQRIFQFAPSEEGRTLFDHSWVEQYYLQAIDDLAESLDKLERESSGHGAPHRETPRKARCLRGRHYVDFFILGTP